MDYNEILQAARTCMGPYCKACPVCNGRACGNTVPGPGSKGLGVTFQRNYQKWQEICVQMDTICENRPADTTFDFFGAKLRLPVLAAPVGAMKLHYGDKYDDATYNDLLVSACRDAGILACTGDGIDAGVMAGALQAINHAGGLGVPTVKPWDRDTVFRTETRPGRSLRGGRAQGRYRGRGHGHRLGGSALPAKPHAPRRQQDRRRAAGDY